MNQDLTTIRPQSDVDAYYEQASRFPLLDAEKERELAERYKKNQDQEAARLLLGSHLRLVIKIARGYAGYGLPLGELIAEGNVGLLQALAKFVLELGFIFSIYSMWLLLPAKQAYNLHNPAP